MNHVALIGRLTAAPELNSYGDTTVTKMRLAIPRVKDSSDADFVDVVSFGRQAEVCQQYLAKGRQVAVQGRLRHSEWQAEDGSRRQRLEVVAEHVEFLGGKSTEQETTPEPAAVA
jgi:single-strand DNA-binding protein